MRRPRLCLAALAALAIAPATATAAAPRTFEVVARQGQEARAISSIHRLGGEVTLRRGSTLQVRLPLSRLARMRASAGVRGAGPVSVGWADTIISQGVYRTGADVLQAQGLRGAGVRIAVLDLGFGTRWRSKLGIELPPASGIDAVQSFDMTTGQPEIAGLLSSDTPTSHGESVAEVVHDMAPDATLTLVNYHTELEFMQAVDWLINGPGGKPRVDVIVHSNSFLDGPFDGSGPTAQEVDKAEAAGILWVNSAGNYAQRHKLLDAHDPEEAIAAAQAIGDDTLQRRGRGRVAPDTFTHGTSAQRVKWFKRGMQTGDPAQCDTFRANPL